MGYHLGFTRQHYDYTDVDQRGEKGLGAGSSLVSFFFVMRLIAMVMSTDNKTGDEFALGRKKSTNSTKKDCIHSRQD